jgi:Domain of Unknown Function (DUF326)
VPDREYQSCREACIRCAEECERCGDACLDESDPGMLAECIRLDRDCAALCWQMAAFLGRDSPFIYHLGRLCAEACDACAAECARHDHEHCQRCAKACRECAEECHRMSAAVV